MIEELDKFDPIAWWNALVSWCAGYLFQANTIYEGVIIAISFIFGMILYRILRKPMQGTISKADIPYRAKKIANNVRKLLFPLITLTVLFFITRLASSELVGVDVSIINGMMKVLLAWIVIRIIVQFIDNNAVRNIFAISIWCVAALSIFGMLEHATQTLDAIGFSIGDIRLSALAVIKGSFYLFALLYFATFISSFAERRVLKSKGLTRSSQVLISKIIRVTLIVFALLVGITSSGIDLSLFAVFGGAIGLGIGFGLQKGISNLFSGILLLIDRSIKPGDVIELENGTFGWVNHMAARYTEIVTRDNKSFLIPNEEFITQRVVNWSHGNSLIRLEVSFGVHYDSNPHDVSRLATEAAANAHDRICKDPTPVCHLIEFGDSSLNFKLRFWITDAEKGVTNMRGAVMLALWDTFKENNIAIPYPHREVFIHERS
ncbi:MAG: mechanosensitive ion channel family protein [Zetaproteobacteria bacterium]|nr:MAG: mechanosensitive ion channel family protein [Zetaproteobacteria bacterium]